MTYYEFSLYARSRSALDEIRQTLVETWEFDPNNAEIYPSWDYGSKLGRPLRFLRRLLGIRHRDDFHMFITGPEIYRSKVQVVVEAWEGCCDGGGYDFSYDPSQYYTSAQIYRHTVQWKAKAAEDERRYLASLPEDEQARVRQAMQDLTAHIRAHESDE